ncbi:MAG: hypothetical protein Q9218_001733 [Villophora microphyllina]
MISSVFLLVFFAISALSIPLTSSKPASLSKRQETITYYEYEYVSADQTQPQDTTQPQQQQQQQQQQQNPPSTPDSNSNDILNVINKYRTAYSKPTLTWSSTMASAAANTGALNNGIASTAMQHHNPQNAAEVINPGSDSDTGGVDLKGHTPFELSLLSWLCESYRDVLGSGCDDQKSVMNVYNLDKQDPTGHHDILVDERYTQIGCAFTRSSQAGQDFVSQGLWVCDLTF